MIFCYCAESRRAARLLTARYDAHLAAAGVTSAQFELMQVIASAKNPHGRALADLLAVDPATLSRNLKVLVASKWVRAQRDKDDNRQTRYSLTSAGDERLLLARPLWQRAHRATQEAFGAEGEAVRRSLGTVTATLRSHPYRTPARG